MPALVEFAFRDPNTTGSSNSYSTLSGALRFNTADSNTGGPSDNPLIRPAGPTTNRSFSKNVRIRVTTLPAASLLNLRIRSSVSQPVIGAEPASGITLAYSFIQLSDYAANVSTEIPRKVGALPNTDVTWLSGRSLGGAAGAPVGSHDAGGSLVNGDMWRGQGAGCSDMLYLQMEVSGSGFTTGGTVTSFNLIASYNEI